MALRILIADDNEINRDFLCAVLDGRGWQIETARDGAEAVAACAERRYDLILMDIRMPEVDGVTATRRIRRQAAHGDVPILALTADLQLRQRDHLRAHGFSDTLLKPVSRADLLAAIARALGEDREIEAEEPAADDPIDEATALAAAGGNAELVARLTTMLMSELEDFEPKITAAIESGDPAAARELVHKLRASAGFCGALELRDRAGELEDALAAESKAIASALVAFSAAIGRLRAHHPA